jgi:putative flippase GtrA
MSLAVRYILFAVVSTAVNFLTQEMVVTTLPILPVAASILAGTATGFAAKYVLDKKWVFLDDYTTGLDELRKVSLYGLFSIVTTLVFWAFEMGAWALWQTDPAKYAGGAMGLAIGYAAKYALDRRYVFRLGRA